MQSPRTNGSLRMVVVGGIGAGKTTVLERLAALGAEVIVADTIGHDVLEPWGGAFDAVAQRWPHVVHHGEVDRAALAAIVFSDAEELQALEAISHPAIAREIARRAELAGDRPVVVELPVEANLAGDGWYRVAVVAPRAIRIDRAVERGIDREDASRRADRQPDDTAWVAMADEVIVNDGTMEGLLGKVDDMWNRLTGNAG